MRHAASTASWRVKSVASPIQRVAEEALIGLHRGAFFVVNEELDTRPDHRRAGFLRARAERDRHIFGTEAETEIVSRPRHGPVENRPGWTAQRDADFGRRHREPLADANLKRHPCHRHESIASRIAAKVSTSEFAATPGSRR